MKISTKDRILSAALDLFSSKGYDGVGVDLIAETVGVKGPSIYKHFKGKEDILNTLIDNISEYYGAGMKKEVKISSVEDLIDFSMKQVLFTINDERIIKVRKLLATEQFRNGKLSKLETIHTITMIKEQYKSLFINMINDGLLKECDVEILALEYIAPVSLLIQQCDREPEKMELCIEQIRKHFEHFVLVHKV